MTKPEGQEQSYLGLHKSVLFVSLGMKLNDQTAFARIAIYGYFSGFVHIINFKFAGEFTSLKCKDNVQGLSANVTL